MDRVRLPLFLLRIGVFIVMLMWTLDKFVRPGHAAGIFKKFYGIDGLSPTVFYVIGALELLLLVGFVTGTAKRYTYGLVLLLHAISTLSSYRGTALSEFGGHRRHGAGSAAHGARRAAHLRSGTAVRSLARRDRQSPRRRRASTPGAFQGAGSRPRDRA